MKSKGSRAIEFPSFHRNRYHHNLGSSISAMVEEGQHTASLEDSNAARLPLGYRDQCSALLIPLNKCRKQTLYRPWKCEDERHTYEKCQYDDFIRRQKALSRQALAAREEEE